MSFLYSPSAGSKIEVSISSNFVEIKADAIPEFGAEKGTYDTTSISDLAKSFGADLPDYGEVTLQGIFDSTEAAQVYLQGSAANPAAVESFKVTFAKKSGASTAASATFSALVLSWKVSASKGGPQKYQSKLKLTGAVSWTAAA